MLIFDLVYGFHEVRVLFIIKGCIMSTNLGNFDESI